MNWEISLWELMATGKRKMKPLEHGLLCEHSRRHYLKIWVVEFL
jgi:hypothetical protein